MRSDEISCSAQDSTPAFLLFGLPMRDELDRWKRFCHLQVIFKVVVTDEHIARTPVEKEVTRQQANMIIKKYYTNTCALASIMRE
jgi:hypothetical protein